MKIIYRAKTLTLFVISAWTIHALGCVTIESSDPTSAEGAADIRNDTAAYNEYRDDFCETILAHYDSCGEDAYCELQFSQSNVDVGCLQANEAMQECFLSLDCDTIADDRQVELACADEIEDIFNECSDYVEEFDDFEEDYEYESEESSSSSFEGTCCLNGAFYECPDSDAVDMCGEWDSSRCSRVSSRDGECNF